MTYELGDGVPPSLLSDVEAGTNVLVSGPAMSGKRELMLEVLAHGAAQGEGSVVLTTNDSGAKIHGEFQSLLEGPDSFVRVIDTVGSEEELDYEEVLKPCGSPGDLTGMGIEFSEIAKEANSLSVDSVRVAFDSLSPVLMYVDLERLFRFLHVFTRQVQSKGWIGLFAIDPESHDSQTINTLNQLFDGVIQIRLPDEGGREMRTRGFGQSPSEWVAVD